MSDITGCECRDLPHVGVHVLNGDEIARATEALPPVSGYVRSTWEIFSAPLFAAGAQPVQVLKSDDRRGRALIISLDQDIYVASTEAELLLTPGKAVPEGGYWPKLLPMELKDSDPLYVLSAATGSTRVTVHAESTA